MKKIGNSEQGSQSLEHSEDDKEQAKKSYLEANQKVENLMAEANRLILESSNEELAVEERQAMIVKIREEIRPALVTAREEALEAADVWLSKMTTK